MIEMNQSFASLIRIKLFQGSNYDASDAITTNNGNERRDKRSRNWLKVGRSSNKNSSSSVLESDMSETCFSNSEEHQKLTPEEPNADYAEDNHSDDDEGDVVDDIKTKENKNYRSRSYSHSSAGEACQCVQNSAINANEQGSPKKHGKLRSLKGKMGIPELHFRSNSFNRHSRRSWEMSKRVESSPVERKPKNSRVYSILPNSISPKRSSTENSYTSVLQVPKYGLDTSLNEGTILSRTSSGSSSISSTNPLHRKTNIMIASSANSSVRFIDPVISVPNNNTATPPTTRLKNNALSNEQSSRHSKTNSFDIKNAAVKSLAIGRRRSRTVDASDYTRKPHFQLQQQATGGNDIISSITTHLKKSRSNSLLIKSPLISPVDKTTAIIGTQEKGSVSPTRHSDNIIFSNITAPSAPTTTTSRRSSSIVNALNTFVNLRSASVSSFKGSNSKTVTPKFDIKLDDYPPPPEPEEDEFYDDYLRRLSPYGKFLGVILCQKSTTYKLACLNHFLSNYFDFKYEPLDISLRKLLMFLELPPETQQIDKLLTEFAKCYYDTQVSTQKYCSWSDHNQVYLVVFSLLMLHTDFFNPNNKCKLTKDEFVSLVYEDQVAGGYDIPKDILSYYFDNITAKESPKFDFSCYQQLTSPEDANQQNIANPGPISPNIYSPNAIIKATASTSLQVCTPISYSLTGRPSSNSFSSYFPQIPASNSSSTNSIIQDDVDIYSHILDGSIGDLNMSSDVAQIYQEPNFCEKLTNRGNKYEKYFSILNETKGGYLRLHKDQLNKINFSNFEVIRSSDGNDHLLVKIVHMGVISEMTVNKKFSIVGSVNKILWKKEFAMLTSCGLLVFDNADWIETSLLRDKETATSNYVIDYKPSSSVLCSAPLTCSGLLATTESNDIPALRNGVLRSSDFDTGSSNQQNSTGNCQDSKNMNAENTKLHLYSSRKKFIWNCRSKIERDNWIEAINLMASYDGCYYNYGSLTNGLITQRKHDITERLSKLDTSKTEKEKKLSTFQGALELYKQATPLSSKTRSELFRQIKQLAVKMEWLEYDIKRSRLHSEIIQQISSQFKESVHCFPEHRAKDCVKDLNSINESFIFNDEFLHSCFIDE